MLYSTQKRQNFGVTQVPDEGAMHHLDLCEEYISGFDIWCVGGVLTAFDVEVSTPDIALAPTSSYYIAHNQ